MESVVSSLAVLAFVGVVLLLFAFSALLRLMRDLQAGLAELRMTMTAYTGDESHLQVDAFSDDDGRHTYAMVVDSSCPACQGRSSHFATLSVGPSTRLAAISADPLCAGWFAGSEVEVRIDGDLVGHVGVSVTPTLIKYDSAGREQWRRVVASDADLERLLGMENTGRHDGHPDRQSVLG